MREFLLAKRRFVVHLRGEDLREVEEPLGDLAG